jgi:hypothetical protein
MVRGVSGRWAIIALAAILLLFALIIVATDNVSAAQEGDYTYSLSGSPTVATITGYNGPGGDITTPATLGGYPTESIGGWAFALSSLTSINIHNGVTSIEEGAFYSCTSLSRVTIPASVNFINNFAFESCISLTSISFLGSDPPYTGTGWIYDTNEGLRGHANGDSNFPAPGGVFNGLTMGDVNFWITIGDDAISFIWLILIVVVLGGVVLFLWHVYGNEKPYSPSHSPPVKWSVNEPSGDRQARARETDRQRAPAMSPPVSNQYDNRNSFGRQKGYCPWCGTPTEGSPFCRYCGGNLER